MGSDIRNQGLSAKEVGAGVAVAGVSITFPKAGKQSSLFSWLPPSTYNSLFNCDTFKSSQARGTMSHTCNGITREAGTEDST